MRTLSIICITLLVLVAIAGALKNHKAVKPKVTLERRHGRPIWRRLPEERKKLSVFPRNNKKFVVTEKTTLKTAATTAPPPFKRPVMKKFFLHDKVNRNDNLPQKSAMQTKEHIKPTTPRPKKIFARKFNSKKLGLKPREDSINNIPTNSKRGPNGKFRLNKGNLVQMLDSINKAALIPEMKNEQTNKVSFKKESKAIQNDNPSKIRPSDNVAKEIVHDKSKNETVTKTEVKVEKVTEKVVSTVQVDNVTHKNGSSNVKTYGENDEEYEYYDNYYDNNEANTTTVNIIEEVSKVTEKGVLSKPTENNSPDNVFNNYIAEKSGPTNTISTTQIQNEEYESTTIGFTEDPQNFNESENRELNNRNDHLYLDLMDQHTDEKQGTTNNPKTNSVKTFMNAIIATDILTDSDDKPAEIMITPTHTAEEIMKDIPLKIENEFDYYDSVKPITKENESKISTEIKIDVPEIKVNDKKEMYVTDTVNVLKNAEINNDVNVELMHRLQDLIKDTGNKSTSEDVKVSTKKTDFILNIIEDTVRPISLEYDAITSELSAFNNSAVSPMEITFDKANTSIPEEVFVIPITVDKTDTDSINEVLEKNENIIIDYSTTERSNTDTKTNDDKSVITNDLHNLAEIIKTKSGDDSEVVVDKSQFVNLDMNIAEANSDKRYKNDRKVEEPSQKTDLEQIYVTRTPIEINYDSQETFVTQKSTLELVLNDKVDKITDNSVTHHANSVSDVTISTTEYPEAKTALKNEDEDIDVVCAIEILSNKPKVDEFVDNSAPGSILTNLNEVINNISNLKENNEVILKEMKLSNEDTNDIEEDIVNPRTVTALVDIIFPTQKTNIKNGRVLDNFTSNVEPHSSEKKLTTAKNNSIESATENQIASTKTNHLYHHVNNIEQITNPPDTTTLVLDGPFTVQNVYDKQVTDSPIIDLIIGSKLPSTTKSDKELLHSKENAIINTNLPIELKLQRIEDGSYEILAKEENTNPPDFADIINSKSDSATITVHFEETTQKTYFKGEHLDVGPIAVLFDAFEPLSSNKLLPSRSLKEETIGSVTETPSLNNEVVSNETTDKISFTSEETAAKYGISVSNPSEFIANYVVGEDVTTEIIGDHSIYESNELSHISSIAVSLNTAANHEMSVEIITEASVDLTKQVLNESQVLNNNLNSLVESDTKLPNDLEHIVAENLNETHILNENFTSFTSNELSYVNLTDMSSNFGEENLIPQHVSNEISSNLTAEKMSEVEKPSNYENLTDHISNEILSSLTLNEEITDEKLQNNSKTVPESTEPLELNENLSSVITNTKNSNERIAVKSKNISIENWTELILSNEITNNLVVNEKLSDEKLPRSSENFAQDISHEPHVVNENVSDITTTTDKYKNFSVSSGHDISHESHIFNDNASRITITEVSSYEKTADKDKHFSVENSNESYLTNETSNSTINVELSDDKLLDTSKNGAITVNETRILNQGVDSRTSNEEISNQKEKLNIQHVSDEISNNLAVTEKNTVEKLLHASEKIAEDVPQPHAVDESLSSITTTTDKYKNFSEVNSDFTYEISNQSAINVELPDEKLPNTSENGAHDISHESYIFNENASRITITEATSYEKTTEKFEHFSVGKSDKSYLTHEISNSAINVESSDDKLPNPSKNGAITHILNQSVDSRTSNEEISDQKVINNFESFSAENFNVQHVSDEISNNLAVTEKITDEKLPHASENIAEGISYELHAFNDSESGITTTDTIFNDNTTDKYETFSGENSNPTYFTYAIFNKSATNVELSDEKLPNTSENGAIIINENQSLHNVRLNEEISNENMIEKSENLSAENFNIQYVSTEIPNNLVVNEITSNEKLPHASGNIVEDISHEPQVFNENASSIKTTEEIFDEQTTEKHEYLTVEKSNEPHFIYEISNNSAMNVELSDEKLQNSSENGSISINETHISNQSLGSVTLNDSEILHEEEVEKSENSIEFYKVPHVPNDVFVKLETIEETDDEKTNGPCGNVIIVVSNDPHNLSEFLNNLDTHEISDMYFSDKMDSLADEGEELSNEIVTDRPDLIGEIPNELLISFTAPSETDLIGEEILKENIDEPINAISKDVTTAAVDIHHPKTGLPSDEMINIRRKRSSNVIEEEDAATTVSGFKYTGQEIRLEHGSSFKNINA